MRFSRHSLEHQAVTLNQLKRPLGAVLILLAVGVAGLAQAPRRAATRVPAPPAIREANVQAEMTFLASDAMQGRGSGTIFERVAAEYIGSQFMQFGLEPAGDKDAMGKQTYVQAATGPHLTWNAIGKITGG